MKSLSGLKNCLNSALLGLGTLGLTWLSGCSTPTTAPPPPQRASQPPEVKPEPRPQATPAPRAPEPSASHSLARNAKDYRKDAASHLYVKHSHQIYKGRLPPMLEAVGVLNVNIDRQGDVKSINWMRAPRHVPQVMNEIERLVKAAAPYPVPRHMSQVTYTDVWLWHKSGKFQLDTLTEGQD
jgi:hypothetical protein